MTQQAGPRKTFRSEQALIGVAVNSFPELFTDQKRPTIDDVVRRLNDEANATDTKDDPRLKERAVKFVKKHGLMRS